MSKANILNGKELSISILEQLKPRAAAIAKLNNDNPPGLATVLVGEDPASHVYVRNKRRACEMLGSLTFITNSKKALAKKSCLNSSTR